MLILGDKYNFTKYELKRLDKKFKNISHVKYEDKDPQKVLTELQNSLATCSCNILVLNTHSKVDDTIIKYLTNLQFSDNKIQMITLEHFMEKYLHKCFIPDEHEDLNFLNDIKPFTKWQYIQKRFIDYLGVFCLFFFSWPVILYARKKIKKESPGTSVFKQYRVGKNNKEFKCVKFRSMHQKTEFFNHYTQEDDPRIFPWGETMRKTRVDELPQMINVLKGEMHLIGPRAEWNELVKNYEEQIPYYNERHLIAPGITGWAQVNYPYGANIEDTKQKLMYDLYYIKYWNILLELKIVWKTAMTVIGRKGL